MFSFLYHSGSDSILVLFSRHKILLGMVFASFLSMGYHGVPLAHLVYLSQPHSEGKHNQSSAKSFSCRMKGVGLSAHRQMYSLVLSGRCLVSQHDCQIKPGHTIKLEYLRNNKDLFLFVCEYPKYFMVHTCILKSITY